MGLAQFIAHVNYEKRIGAEAFFPAIYLTAASGHLPADENEQVDPFDYVANLYYTARMPSYKLVPNLLGNGTYAVECGPITDAIMDDHSLGRIDTNRLQVIDCNPKPPHAKWRYWESKITTEQKVVPEFRCLLIRGEWWIVDADRNRGLAQQVAALDFVDDPAHN